jgi:hypothetical protein
MVTKLSAHGRIKIAVFLSSGDDGDSKQPKKENLPQALYKCLIFGNTDQVVRSSSYKIILKTLWEIAAGSQHFPVYAVECKN